MTQTITRSSRSCDQALIKLRDTVLPLTTTAVPAVTATRNTTTQCPTSYLKSSPLPPQVPRRQPAAPGSATAHTHGALLVSKSGGGSSTARHPQSLSPLLSPIPFSGSFTKTKVLGTACVEPCNGCEEPCTSAGQPSGRKQLHSSAQAHHVVRRACVDTASNDDRARAHEAGDTTRSLATCPALGTWPRSSVT